MNGNTKNLECFTVHFNYFKTEMTIWIRVLHKASIINTLGVGL